MRTPRQIFAIPVFVFLLLQPLFAGYVPPSVQNMAWNQQQQMNNYNYNSGPTQYKFTVTFPSGKEEIITSAIYLDDFKKTFIRRDDDKVFDFSKKDSQKLYPSHIKLLQWVPANPNDSIMTAVVMNGQWVFPKIKGKLTVYSDEPAGEFKYLKLGDEPYSFYSRTNLKLCLSGNPEAANLLRTQEVIRVLGVMIMVAGGTISAIGLASSSIETKPGDPEYSRGEKYKWETSPLIFIGLGVIAGGGIAVIAVKENHVKAIMKFNFNP